MRLIVQVQWGPMRGRKALLAPGETLRVGRLERADLVVPHDEELSGVHFELSWDGSRCAGRDLASARGTEWNGEREARAELGHGDWIRAGETFFSIYFEGVVPAKTNPGNDKQAPPVVPDERKAEVLAALRAEPGPLYAVVDVARDEWIPHLLAATPGDVQSLYDGAEGEELADVAPCLVALSEGSWVLERLVAHGWGQGWGIVLSCPRPFRDVRRHLRRLLIVQEKETETPLYFRFYDPKVLPVVLKVCSPRQKQQIFGDIDRFLIEGAQAEMVAIERARP